MSTDASKTFLAGATLLGVAATFAWLFWPEAAQAGVRRARTTSNPIDFSKARLHFVNDFEDATFGGLHFPGLCGGMSFTALDYWHAERSPDPTTVTPSTEDDGLGQYIHDRQQDSLLAHPTNLASFIAMLADPSDDIVAKTTADAFDRLKGLIDRGDPVPIGLAPSPWTIDATSAHQVVATGYEESPDGRIVHIWDPNYPNALHTALRQAAQETRWVEWGDGGETGDVWRGFFVEAYSPEDPPTPEDSPMPEDSPTPEE